MLAFLADRTHPVGGYGLSFAVGLLVLAATVVGLAQLTEDVLSGDGLTWVDAPVNDAVPGIRTDAVTRVFRAWTLLGGPPGTIAVVVLGGLLLWHRAGTWRPALLLAVIGGGAAVLDAVYKMAVARPRPPAVHAIADATGYAFPSGHATQSAVYGGLAYLLAATARHVRTKVLVWVVAIVVGGGIGISRVYLGVHWVTDVLAGWLLGTAWLVFVLMIATTLARIHPEAALLPPATTRDPSRGGVSSAAMSGQAEPAVPHRNGALGPPASGPTDGAAEGAPGVRMDLTDHLDGKGQS